MQTKDRVLQPVSYCESVWATSISPWHLRMLDPGEHKVFGGGLTKPAMCGAEVAWDIDTDVTVERVLNDIDTVCPHCRVALEIVLHDTV